MISHVLKDIFETIDILHHFTDAYASYVIYVAALYYAVISIHQKPLAHILLNSTIWTPLRPAPCGAFLRSHLVIEATAKMLRDQGGIPKSAFDIRANPTLLVFILRRLRQRGSAFCQEAPNK